MKPGIVNFFTKVFWKIKKRVKDNRQLRRKEFIRDTIDIYLAKKDNDA